MLFLVDTKNLGEQAEKEFQAYTPQDYKRKFTDLYVVQRLSSNSISPAAHVCISTIQRMYSILRGEKELTLNDEKSLNEGSEMSKPVEVKYNSKIPIEMFDVIIIDECHRSIYNLWKQVDEEVTYVPKELDSKVVNPDQIRTILKAFKEKINTEIFPNRKEVLKTLIFAKTDSHEEDIIKIVREKFGEGNVFCKKVTYANTEEKPSEVLQQFRTVYNPRIAVTVDMIATGTDVKAIECLLFMRDVRSKNYFQQMLGRGTRTFNSDDLKRVTPSANGNKTHFVVIDAVGVCKSIKVDSRPLERKPNISLKDLVTDVLFENTDEDTFVSLANRLSRLERSLNPKEKKDLEKLSGESINETIGNLLATYDPDKIEIQRQTISTAATEEDARKVIVKKIQKTFKQLETVEGRPEQELTALVSIIRRVLEIDPKLTSYDIIVNKNFQRWIFAKHAGKPKYTDEQMQWLRMMKDFIAISIRLEKEDLAELPPFSDKGGLGKAKKLFDSELTSLLDELNEELVA